MIADARQAGLSIRETAELLEYSPTLVPSVFTEWHKNIQCVSVLQIETPCDKRGKWAVWFK